jgi:hypothetical protein
MSDRNPPGERARIAWLILLWCIFCPLMGYLLGYAMAYGILFGSVIGWLVVDCWRAAP